jgi:hypothetical protein
MPRYFIIAVLFLAVVFAAPASAADKASGDNARAPDVLLDLVTQGSCSASAGCGGFARLESTIKL